mmetsp:Transcript_4473/g.7497  ORF Transcript_4473/g.7497 Transcript_4473/m.7497 type:complete len:220 (-) Transcript_4473:1026-1685(-)
MPIINRIRHNITDRTGIGQKHDKPIESHAPSTMGSSSILAQIHKPLKWRHVHILLLHFRLQHIVSPLAHGPTKEFSNERSEQIKGFTRAVANLFHVKGFNGRWPVGDKDKGAKLLDQILFMFRSQILTVLWLFLELEFHFLALRIDRLDLIAQILQHDINGIGMFDPNKGFVQQTGQVFLVTVEFHWRRGLVIEKGILRLATIEDDRHDVFDVSFGLIE